MRIYTTFNIALNEIKRDLVEMGIRVHPHSWQDKIVKDKPEYETLELQNYSYTVTSPRGRHLNPTKPWATEEWLERSSGIVGNPVNPGTAWKLREKVWSQFMDGEGKFGYNYSERFSLHRQVLRVIERIKEDPDSRQLWISVWRPEDIENLGGVSRVPCTLGYQIQVRQGTLNLHYIQRSADLITHFENDIFLAHKLQKFISYSARIPCGRFTHTIFSLHMFKKDAEGVF